MIRKDLLSKTISYPLESLYDLPGILFFDIETTGLSADTASLYLIGAAYYENDSWQYTQWFAASPKEECGILTDFLQFSEKFHTLIHFNGAGFDLPFLTKKCSHYGLTNHLLTLESVDLYRLYKPLKALLKLEKMNQTSFEEFLSIPRNDMYSGRELIPVYYNYVKERGSEELELLLLHNHDDLAGMLELLSLHAYLDLLNGRFEIRNVETDTDRDEFLMTVSLQLTHTLPKKISASLPLCYLTAEGDNCRLLIRGFNGTLKYFFSDYKNYYYLPDEDCAMHKSVASYVEKSHRRQATAATCYTKKTGCFLPLADMSFTPVFKTECRSKDTWFEFAENILIDKALLHQYINSLLLY